MLNNKRAMSSVVATIILVALVIIAIGIVAVVIFNIVGKGANDTELESKCAGTLLKIDSATKTGGTPYVYSIKVSRFSGNSDITGVAVTLANTAGSRVVKKEGNLMANAGSVTVSDTNETLFTTAKVSAYVESGGVTKYCPPSSEVTIA